MKQEHRGALPAACPPTQQQSPPLGPTVAVGSALGTARAGSPARTPRNPAPQLQPPNPPVPCWGHPGGGTRACPGLVAALLLAATPGAAPREQDPEPLGVKRLAHRSPFLFQHLQPDRQGGQTDRQTDRPRRHTQVPVPEPWGLRRWDESGRGACTWAQLRAVGGESAASPQPMPGSAPRSGLCAGFGDFLKCLVGDQELAERARRPLKAPRAWERVAITAARGPTG